MNDQTIGKSEKDPLRRIASAIVSGRWIVFVLFAAAIVFCVLSMGRVKVNPDLTAFLSEKTETRKGVSVMADQFTTYASARVMVEGIAFSDAETLAGTIAALPHVASVSFDDTDEHYRDGSALFAVSFDLANGSEELDGATGAVEDAISPYRYYWQADYRDYGGQVAREMGGILLIAAAVILFVLLFTSRSYFEVLIFGVVFAVAAILNMGTNVWLGELSTITHSVAVILQLALAIDYAIIFAHRYQDETETTENEREALVAALARSIPEIFSSSLTTVSGLAALTLMQFRLGYDLGVVLSKGIVCSMLTVFCLMPGLISFFPRTLRKTKHRPFVPKIEGWGRLLSHKVPVFLLLFAVILPFAIIFSGRTEYAFSNESVTEIVPSEEHTAIKKIRETFGLRTPIALLVPARDYEKEKTVLQKTSELDGVVSATGLAGIEITDGRVLTDRFTAAEFSELLGIEESRVEDLYRLYGVTHGEYAKSRDLSTYSVPLVEMAVYLFGLIDVGTVELTPEQTEQLALYRAPLERAVNQLRGSEWDRIVLTSALPVEGEASEALVEEIRAIAEEEYGAGTVLIAGDVTSARDLHASYRFDSRLIRFLTIGFVFLILLFTFRSPVTAAVLIFVIQGSIWINFSIPYLTGSRASFVTDMIVSAIQMGATIDYAIVMMSRYRANRAALSKREAMVKTVSESFPTVLTSGAIMTAAGLLIAFRVSNVYVGHIGLAVGRGALISVILVLTVLPQLILLFDRAISATTVRFRRKKTEKRGQTDGAAMEE